MNDNPYASPSFQEPELTDNPHFPKASGTQRLINFIVDHIASHLFIEFGLLCLEAVVGRRLQNLNIVLVLTLVFLLWTSYYFIFEGLGGLTLGKLITGTKAVSRDDGRITWKQAAIRSLARLFPFEPFTYFFKDGLLHDRWSGTKVVSLRRGPIPKAPIGPISGIPGKRPPAPRRPPSPHDGVSPGSAPVAGDRSTLSATKEDGPPGT